MVVEGSTLACAIAVPAHKGQLAWRGFRPTSAFWRSLSPAGRMVLLAFSVPALVAIAVGLYLPSALREQVIAVQGRMLQAAATALELSPPPAGRTELNMLGRVPVRQPLDERLIGVDHSRPTIWTLNEFALFSGSSSLVDPRTPSTRPRVSAAVAGGFTSGVADCSEPGRVPTGLESGLVDLYIAIRDSTTGRPVAVLKTHCDESTLATTPATIAVVARPSAALALLALVAVLVPRPAHLRPLFRPTAQSRSRSASTCRQASPLSPHRAARIAGVSARDGLRPQWRSKASAFLATRPSAWAPR